MGGLLPATQYRTNYHAGIYPGVAICLLKGFGNLRDLLLQSNVLAHPPKSEFVEKVRKIKSLLFRHFIYVNLGILVEACQNLPFSF